MGMTEASAEREEVSAGVESATETSALLLLISPLARGAYFREYIAVAEAELRAHFPELDLRHEFIGGLDFLAAQLPRASAQQLRRLSFVQGLFERRAGALYPVDAGPDFLLPEGLVWGEKYRGKTNELLTQLALNLALCFDESAPRKGRTLLDPMAGRGTTLFWAARYGISSVGVERDREALEHFTRRGKRQTKLDKIKHKHQRGQRGPKQKGGAGRSAEFSWAGVSTCLVTGDSAALEPLLAGQRFSLIVSDLPYGVQFLDADGRRDPLEGIRRCAPGWAARLLPGGVMALSFNQLQPKRRPLIELFKAEGLELIPVDVSHRVSESIHRSIALFKRPLT